MFNHLTASKTCMRLVNFKTNISSQDEAPDTTVIKKNKKI
jgi:hypothetical protein